MTRVLHFTQRLLITLLKESTTFSYSDTLRQSWQRIFTFPALVRTISPGVSFTPITSCASEAFREWKQLEF